MEDTKKAFSQVKSLKFFFRNIICFMSEKKVMRKERKYLANTFFHVFRSNPSSPNMLVKLLMPVELSWSWLFKLLQSYTTLSTFQPVTVFSRHIAYLQGLIVFFFIKFTQVFKKILVPCPDLKLCFFSPIFQKDYVKNKKHFYYYFWASNIQIIWIKNTVISLYLMDYFLLNRIWAQIKLNKT